MLTTSAPSPAHLSPPTARNAPPAPALRSYAASKSPSPAVALSSSSPSCPASSATSSRDPSRSNSPALAASRPSRTTVDAATQVTPPDWGRGSPGTSTTAPVSHGSGAKRKEPSFSPGAETPDTPGEPSIGPVVPGEIPLAAVPSNVGVGTGADSGTPTKRARPPISAKTVMPAQYETCEVKDLVQLIAAMLMELIRFNDAIPLRDGRLTRFHSRAPPGISVVDYLQRLTTHATLSPPLLLSMVYYIDRLCALYPAFTISSLTVHRFLIASATVASKGLSDLFWTNTTYARVGGISLKELKVLELEFLTRVEWRIVPQPEVLVDYYRSLIARSDDYVLEGEEGAPNSDGTNTEQ